MIRRGYFDPRPHVVYRCWTGDNRLLYVGCTTDMQRRRDQHSQRSTWWPLVSRVTVEKHPNGYAARLAEKAAIRKEAPEMNAYRMRSHGLQEEAS